MINNDILRRLRYTFDISDAKMMTIFKLADCEVTREQLSNWLKKEDDPDFRSCTDTHMASFLNGFISYKRGAREGGQPKPERRLTNNLIFKKLNIALALKAEDVLEILELAGFPISKHELSSFFRKVDNRHYRVCKDQILRNFLMGLQLKYRPRADDKPATE
ncbi:MAG: DUF1456 family protein [Spongiibacteraceae bacterium]